MAAERGIGYLADWLVSKEARLLADRDKLDLQLREMRSLEQGARRAYLAIALAAFPSGMTIRPSGHGFIKHELRLETQGKWLCSAVLNQKWVLWYFRKPVLLAGMVRAGDTLARFSAATLTRYGEIKLRLHDEVAARHVLCWIGAEARDC